MRGEADPSVASAFGELLREYRIRAGLSQSDLAEKARISPAAVSALERGIRRAPYQSTISLLTSALDLTTEESAALKGARQGGRVRSTKSEVPHNLDAVRTSFVGRDADVADVLKLIERSRLVTITGSGGVGKTRVAIEAATQLLGRFWNETWFIDLAPLADGELIASRIAYTIQPALRDSASSIDALAVALANRRMFLILDNCEHVIAEAARAADTILRQCPYATILATSRERLNVAGEFAYALPPLQKDSAVDLFMQRAQALSPHLTLETKNLPAVIDIVRRLDGIPLAIELTAAQVSTLGVETLRNRLHQDFSVPSGRRDLPARQQTVNATIHWSFNLLASEEQSLLCDVAVFAGGFTLDAAEAVCTEDPHMESSVLPRLSSLVSKSLINVDCIDGPARYTLLESVRAFGLQRLRAEDKYGEVARRHAQWFASRADDHGHVEMSNEVARELLPDIDNIRGAIAWSLGASSQDDRAFAGRIVSGFDRLWLWIGRLREHRQSLEMAISRIDESQQPLLLSRLLINFIAHAGREPAVLGFIDRAVRLCEQLGDGRAQAHLYVVLTSALQVHGMLAEADRAAARASVLLTSEHLENTTIHLAFLANRHELRMAQDRFDDAREDLRMAEAQALAHGERFFVVCRCYSLYSALEYAVGNKHLALEFAERMLASEFGSNPYVAQIALERIAMLRLDSGDTDGIVERLREWLLLRPIDEFPTRAPLEVAALYLALRGRGKDAATLLGSVHVVEQCTHFRRSRMREDAYNRLRLLLQAQLNPEERAAAEAEGALLTGEQAKARALKALQ